MKNCKRLEAMGPEQTSRILLNLGLCYLLDVWCDVNYFICLCHYFLFSKMLTVGLLLSE